MGVTGQKLRRWSAEELRLLRLNYRRYGAEGCAEMFKRSRRAIWSAAHKLGVTVKDPREAQRFHPMRIR